ncbi:2-oxoacid:acceptor oxidoreductase subunit alpha [Candidatus Gracilibacteria bacterium]|nr:2-oxoacid:acceptor oxidoreductase subunit alpha [Candidatus Gracilibacteria bacterium]MCF7819019.1 2-oxoacid:acceptor oxidoreductase subunit alpha [Candidatus Gracilibacteria bacterium]
MAIDKHSLVAYFDTLKKEGIFIHGYERTAGIQDILQQAEKKKIQTVFAPSRKIAFDNGGTEQMANIILTGMLWKVLGFPLKKVEDLVREKFKNKKKILDIALRCLGAGYDAVDSQLTIDVPVKKKKTLLLDGNQAVALGAIQAGMRVYSAYPMSPSSSILSYMAEMASRTGIIVKQAEDEITAAQVSLGAMTAGTRSMTATSGGGYDLMTETVSLAGMIESPFVVLIGQRPGPATGLPTWTAQADLNLALYSSHGEFPRIVMSIADPGDGFESIQHAFNLAEEYQVPVIVLSEKVVCESKMTVDSERFKKIPIRRGLVPPEKLSQLKSEDRFKITPSGISSRWIPGSSETYYFANGDEHWEKGTITEEADEVEKMYQKRMRKEETIREKLPPPEIIGKEKQADISFVGWGSSLTVLKDIIEDYRKKGISVNLLHFRCLSPLNKKFVQEFFSRNSNIHLLEGNYQGQLGQLLEREGFSFRGKLLKYNGRPFFLEDVDSYIRDHISQHG